MTHSKQYYEPGCVELSDQAIAAAPMDITDFGGGGVGGGFNCWDKFPNSDVTASVYIRTRRAREGGQEAVKVNCSQTV